MKLTALQRQILELGVEDLHGLYAAVWWSRPLFPDRSDQELKDMAELAVREILGMGLVRLYYFDGRHPEGAQPIPPKETEAVLSEAGSWEPAPHGTVHVWYAATEKGERVYYGRETNDPDRG